MTCPLTPTVIVTSPSAADSNACTATALPINLSNLEYRLFPPPEIDASLRIALNRRPRAQINRLPLAPPNPGPTSTTNKPLPLSP
jgi:hypothetical protein